MKISRKILAVSGLAMFVLPLLVFAAVLPNPTVPVSGSAVTVGEITSLIERIARWLITISVVVAVIMIVWGGIRYMVARGDDEAVKSAWATIKNGIIGAAIVLAVGVILQTVASIVSRSGLNF